MAFQLCEIAYVPYGELERVSACERVARQIPTGFFKEVCTSLLALQPYTTHNEGPGEDSDVVYVTPTPSAPNSSMVIDY